MLIFIRVAHGQIGLLRNKTIYLSIYKAETLLVEILIKYNLRSVNNMGTNAQTVLRIYCSLANYI